MLLCNFGRGLLKYKVFDLDNPGIPRSEGVAPVTGRRPFVFKFCAMSADIAVFLRRVRVLSTDACGIRFCQPADSATRVRAVAPFCFRKLA